MKSLKLGMKTTKMRDIIEKRLLELISCHVYLIHKFKEEINNEKSQGIS